MRRIITAISCFLLTIVVIGCAMTPPQSPPSPKVTTSELFSPAVYNRIGVYVVNRTRHRLSEGTVRQVEDEFMRAVMEKGYILAARSDIDQIKRELRIQSSDFSEEALARKAKAINVSAIMLVSINNVSSYRYRPQNAVYVSGHSYFIGSASISARLISAELAQVVWISSHAGEYQISDLRRGDEVLVPVAQVVAGGLPSR